MTEVRQFVESVIGFYHKTAVDQLLALAWFVEVREQRSSFDGTHLRRCFKAVGVEAPYPSGEYRLPVLMVIADLTCVRRAWLRSGACGGMRAITGVERRRRWRLEDKLRIVAEAERPGAVISIVARRHDVSRALLCHWRNQVRCGALSLRPPVFLPVHVASEASRPGKSCDDDAAAPAAFPPWDAPVADAADRRIEIALVDGTCVRVGEDVSLAVLRRVLAALRGGSCAA